jgi:lipopolysaccharide export system protein LptC
VTTSTLDGNAPRGFRQVGRTDSAKSFRRARRHSRMVHVLRVAIPIGLVVTVAGFTLATYLDPLNILARLPLDAGKLVISGTKITMEAPKLSGYTQDSRWYELQASAATQDLTKPAVIELHDIHAKLQGQDKSMMNLAAKTGQFARTAGILTLSERILLTSSSGVEVQLSEAVVDTGTGNIVSNKPVEVKMAKAQVNSQRLEVTKAGEVVRFDGGVVMRLTPEAPAEDPQDGGARAAEAEPAKP